MIRLGTRSHAACMTLPRPGAQNQIITFLHPHQTLAVNSAINRRVQHPLPILSRDCQTFSRIRFADFSVTSEITIILLAYNFTLPPAREHQHQTNENRKSLFCSALGSYWRVLTTSHANAPNLILVSLRNW